MEYVNPVMEGIKTYRAVDDIFRARRQDERQIEKDTYDRNRQQQQDAMAAETHNLQTTATKEALRKIEEERLRTNYKALQFKLNAIADGDLGPDAVDDNEYQLMEKDPALAPYIKDIERRKEVIKATASLHNDIPEAAGMYGPRSPEAYGRIVESLNAIYPSRNTVGGPQYKRIVDVRMRPDGKFAIEAEFERVGEDGKIERYIAPFTKNMSADPNDPVNFYSMDEVLPKIVGNAKILHALDKVLDSRRIALGDDEPVKEAIKNKKEAKALKVATDAIEKLPDGPTKTALKGVLPSVVTGDIPAATGDTLIKAAIPEQEEVKWEDNVLGKDGKPYRVAYNKAGKEIKRERQYVKPEKGDGSGAGSKMGTAEKQLYTHMLKAWENMQKVISLPAGSKTTVQEYDPLTDTTKEREVTVQKDTIDAARKTYYGLEKRGMETYGWVPDKTSHNAKQPKAVGNKQTAVPSGAVTISQADLAKLPKNPDGTVTYQGKKYRVQ